MMKKTLTLKEVLIFILAATVVSAAVLFVTQYYTNKVAYSRAIHELRQIQKAVYLYQDNHGGMYPPEADGLLPPELGEYLSPDSDWEHAPFPGSHYDWDNWAPEDLAYPPSEQVRQVSVRFCDTANGVCAFPSEEWSQGFDEYSALYLCLEGPCRSHATQPVTHPGISVN